MATHVEYLIIGQGIAGSLIGYELELSGISFAVVDNDHKQSSSIVAAGTINPVTGRNYVKTWLADQLIDQSDKTYHGLSQILNASVHRHKSIIRALHTIKDENAWLSRSNDPTYDRYISKKADAGKMISQVHLTPVYGEIIGSSQVNLPLLLSLLKHKWAKEGKIISLDFDHSKLTKSLLSPRFKYGDIHAENIIFCEGHMVLENPYFNYLEFEPVKGEALIIEVIDGFDKSLRDGTFITPLGKDNLYWCGSGYQWDYDNLKPSQQGKEAIQKQLDQLLRVKYRIADHIAGVRPSTKYRKPFIGSHPTIEGMYIFNGMGTKGSSLAPYFAKLFVKFLANPTRENDLSEEVNISRFAVS